MFKYLVIINLLVLTVLTQDMPPPNLDLTTEKPANTPKVTTLEPTTTTSEVESTPFETTTTEEITTTTVEATSATTKEISETPELTTTTRNNEATPPTTDSPFLTTTEHTASDPLVPFYSSCYFKKQYGYLQLKWTCEGFKYVYPVECFQCCQFGFANFAGCYQVHYDHCKNLV